MKALTLHVHLSDAFIQSDLQCIQVIHYFIGICVLWELNPRPFVLLTQCSTTDPQEHIEKKNDILAYLKNEQLLQK